MSAGRRPSLCSEDGSTAAEAGVVISVLLLLIVGSVELGRALWTYNTMLLAVEQAGRYAMVHHNGPGETCNAQRQASQCPAVSDTPLANCSAEWAQRVLSAYLSSNIGVSVSHDATSSPATLTICVGYSLDFFAPQLLPFGAFDLTQQVTVPLI
jgi:Flp pilus assembly protein TadG